MKFHWVSLLIQNAENSKLGISAISSGCINFGEAMETIGRGRNNAHSISLRSFAY